MIKGLRFELVNATFLDFPDATPQEVLDVRHWFRTAPDAATTTIRSDGDTIDMAKQHIVLIRSAPVAEQ